MYQCLLSKMSQDTFNTFKLNIKQVTTFAFLYLCESEFILSISLNAPPPSVTFLCEN